MLGFACFPTISRAVSVCLIEFRSETRQLTTLNPTYITPTPKSVITSRIRFRFPGRVRKRSILRHFEGRIKNPCRGLLTAFSHFHIFTFSHFRFPIIISPETPSTFPYHFFQCIQSVLENYQAGRTRRIRPPLHKRRKREKNDIPSQPSNHLIHLRLMFQRLAANSIAQNPASSARSRE